MSRGVAVWDRWDRGDYGTGPAWDLPAGSFTGNNVVLYVGGGIGPRNGFEALFIRNPPDTPTIKILGLTYNNGIGRVWAICTIRGGTVHVYQSALVVPPNLPTLSDLGAVNGAVGTESDYNIASVTIGSVLLLTYVSVASYGIVKIDHRAGRLTDPVTTAAKGRSIAVYGDRLMVGGPSQAGATPHPNQNRVYFSAAGDYNTWPALNYFDVGDVGSPVTGLYPLRGRLVVTKGIWANEWWEVTGVPGVNALLRRISSVEAPAVHRAGVTVPDDTAVGFGALDTAAAKAVPGVFTGSATSLTRALPPGGTAAFTEITATVARRLKHRRDWLLWSNTSPKGFVLQRDGVWTRHSGMDGNSSSQHVAYDPLLDLLVTCPDNLFSLELWKPYNDRPPDPSVAGVGTPINPTLTLPEWWDRRGDEVRVRGLVVDFRKWSSSDTRNAFTAAVTMLRRTGQSGEGPPDRALTASFSEAPSLASSTGTPDRKLFPLRGPYANGFRVDFSLLRGVAIEKVTALLDARPIQGI